MAPRLVLVSSLAIVLAAPAYAGDEVLYEAAPDWVDVTATETLKADGASPLLMTERQVRLESGRVRDYRDMAFSFTSPEMMTQLGTVSASWLPDKGDLTVHRVELIRGDEVIDLAADRPFEILRRELQLEQRMMNGMLTATMTVPGARQGDILRVAYSTTLSDQALGDEVQWLGVLPPEPLPMKHGRTIVSWPEDLAVDWRIHRVGHAVLPETIDGHRFVTVELPVPEPKEMPNDAPSRYQLPPMLQAGTIRSYAQLSSLLAPYYDEAARISPGSSLAEQVATIEAETADPVGRMAAAVRFVQDEISYLMNGLDGGNYLPQSASETWDARFGDCKAKSVLLVALLREMGIESDVALVNSGIGDALPELLPMAANFDHMIVKASVGGVDYWLDGTSGGTRLSTLAEIPAFRHALPLRQSGATLVALPHRGTATPDRHVALTIDQRAGLPLPALFEIEVGLTGAMGAAMRPIAGQDDEELTEAAVDEVIRGIIGPVQMTEYALDYDDESGRGSVTAKGIMTTPWRKERGRFELEPPAQEARNLDFENNRARPDWRDVPVRLNGPIYFASDLEVLLPQGGDGFDMTGEERIDREVGTVAVASKASLGDERFALEQSMRSTAFELPATALAAAKRDRTILLRELPELVAPEDARNTWDYFGDDRALLAPLEAAYAKLIDEAEEDEAEPLTNRGNFRVGVFDFAGALEDYDALVAFRPDAAIYGQRSFVREQTGDLEGALDDLQALEDLAGDGSTFLRRIEILGLLGRGEEAVGLADDYAEIAEETRYAATGKATALGYAGRAEEGAGMIEAELARRPGDADLLNAACWHEGTWNLVDESTIDLCTRAVEKSDYSPPVLDSRGLAFFRLGRFEEALADYDAALADDVALPPTRYMRGLVKLELGREQAGREEIALALRMMPSLAASYAAWGLEPPR